MRLDVLSLMFFSSLGFGDLFNIILPLANVTRPKLITSQPPYIQYSYSFALQASLLN